MSGDVIILEEAAYCDPGLISEVVVPLLSMQSSCLLCISTLLESGNHYSKMFELRDQTTNEPLFETISITLVCDACLRTDHPEKCTHKLASMPRWLSSQKMEVVKQLLSDDPAMLLRESMGVGADSTQKAFASSEIDAFLQREPLEIEARSWNCHGVKHVCVAIDPAGGGSSAFAIASTVQLTSGTVMVRHLISRYLWLVVFTRHLGSGVGGNSSANMSSISMVCSTNSQGECPLRKKAVAEKGSTLVSPLALSEK